MTLGFLCGRRAFLLLYMEGSFILLPADDMTTVDKCGLLTVSCSRVITRQWNGMFCNALAVSLENVALLQQLEFYLLFLQYLLTDGAAGEQVRDPCSPTT